MSSKRSTARTFGTFFSVIIFILSVIVAALNFNMKVTILSIFISVIFMIIILGLTENLDSGIFTGKNRELDVAERAIFNLFHNANEQICVLSGALNPLLFTESVINAIKEAKDRNVDIQVLISYQNPKQEEFITWLTKNASFMRLLHKDFPPHFIVVDAEHVRFERIHKPDDQFRPADLQYYVPRLAKFYLNRFEKLKKEARSLKIKQVA